MRWVILVGLRMQCTNISIFTQHFQIIDILLYQKKHELMYGMVLEWFVETVKPPLDLTWES